MAGRLILTTVGTSAVNQNKLERIFSWGAWRDLKRSLPSQINQHRVWLQSGAELPRPFAPFRESYLKFLSELSIDEEIQKPLQDGLNVFSAEVTSLYLMKLDVEADQVVLLLSDTAEGVLCGLLVQDYLKEKFSISPELEIIKGLRIDRFQEFFDNGLKYFFEVVSACIENSKDKSLVLNVTGGFKSLIPYATYVALAHDMELYLSYEEQPEPIRIDPKRWPETVRIKARAFQEELRQQPEIVIQQASIGNPPVEG